MDDNLRFLLLWLLLLIDRIRLVKLTEARVSGVIGLSLRLLLTLLFLVKSRLWSDLSFHGLLFRLFLFLLKVKYGLVVVVTKGSVLIIEEFFFELHRLFLNFILYFFLCDFIRLLFFFFLCNLFDDIPFDLFRH